MSNLVRAKFNTSTGIINTTSPVTLSNTSIINITGTNRMDALVDVVATTELEGAVPIYDSATDKYVIRNITGNLVFGAIDGGIF